MDLRELEYFLAVAHTGTISGAAQALHMAQPSLSRQMKDLEECLGKKLFIRGSRHITLTEEGLILQKRAEELIRLWQKTEGEIENIGTEVSGDIYIGAAETKAVHYLTKAARRLLDIHPDVHLHIASGDTTDAIYQLEQGLIDFALLFYLSADEKYNVLPLQTCDIWGALMLKSNPLAAKKSLSFSSDLANQPLIMSRLVANQIAEGITTDNLNIVATYNLAYNASLMVEDGLGIAICFDSIVNVNNNADNQLCFVPISDMDVEIKPCLIWKRNQVLSRASQEYISILRDMVCTKPLYLRTQVYFPK